MAKKSGPGMGNIKKRGMLGSPIDTKQIEEKETLLAETNKTATEQNELKKKQEEKNKKLQQIEAQHNRKIESEQLKEKRAIRKNPPPKLKTIEEVGIPEEYFQNGETRVSILYDLNEALNRFARKKRVRTNAQLSQIIYEYLKDKGELD